MSISRNIWVILYNKETRNYVVFKDDEGGEYGYPIKYHRTLKYHIPINPSGYMFIRLESMKDYTHLFQADWSIFKSYRTEERKKFDYCLKIKSLENFYDVDNLKYILQHEMRNRKIKKLLENGLVDSKYNGYKDYKILEDNDKVHKVFNSRGYWMIPSRNRDNNYKHIFYINWMYFKNYRPGVENGNFRKERGKLMMMFKNDIQRQIRNRRIKKLEDHGI